ncbi:MAG: hypothetical protein LBC18_03550, partial [Opitutaceae bacterium]|nr:hypothetical protein [Opitutaceae bacterium]
PTAAAARARARDSADSGEEDRSRPAIGEQRRTAGDVFMELLKGTLKNQRTTGNHRKAARRF